jgi:hypothetical protein
VSVSENRDGGKSRTPITANIIAREAVDYFFTLPEATHPALVRLVLVLVREVALFDRSEDNVSVKQLARRAYAFRGASDVHGRDRNDTAELLGVLARLGVIDFQAPPGRGGRGRRAVVRFVGNEERETAGLSPSLPARETDGLSPSLTPHENGRAGDAKLTGSAQGTDGLSATNCRAQPVTPKDTSEVPTKDVSEEEHASPPLRAMRSDDAALESESALLESHFENPGDNEDPFDRPNPFPPDVALNGAVATAGITLAPPRPDVVRGTLDAARGHTGGATSIERRAAKWFRPHTSGYWKLRNEGVPADVIERAFLTCKRERITSPEKFQKLAREMAKGGSEANGSAPTANTSPTDEDQEAPW